MRKTSKQYRAEVSAKFGTRLVVLDRYEVASKPIRHQCGLCQHVWSARPHNILSRDETRFNGCPKCRDKQSRDSQLLDQRRVERRLDRLHEGKLQLRGQYRGRNRKHRFRCLVCLNTWKAAIGSVFQGVGCPHCARHKGWNTYRYKEVKVGGVVFRVQGYEPQALRWLVTQRNVKPKDIVVDSTGRVPVIDYRVGRRNRRYYPDIYLPKAKRIVEVKSGYTLGLDTGRGWKKNQEKAKAVIAEGYKFTLLVMNEKGQCLMMPKKWFDMTRKEVVLWIAYQSGQRG